MAVAALGRASLRLPLALPSARVDHVCPTSPAFSAGGAGGRRCRSAAPARTRPRPRAAPAPRRASTSSSDVRVAELGVLEARARLAPDQPAAASTIRRRERAPRATRVAAASSAAGTQRAAVRGRRVEHARCGSTWRARRPRARRHPDDLDAEVEVVRHAAHHGELLEVLLAEHRDVRLTAWKSLVTTVVTPRKWPGRCAPHSGSASGPARRGSGTVRGTCRAACGDEQQRRRRVLEQGPRRARARAGSGQVVRAVELDRVHEDRHHDAARRASAPPPPARRWPSCR